MSAANRHEEHCSELDEIKAALARIESALVGDVAMGHVGIVQRVGAHDARLQVIEEGRSAEAAQKRGAMMVIAGASAIAGAVGGFITWAAGLLNHAPKP